MGAGASRLGCRDVSCTAVIDGWAESHAIAASPAKHAGDPAAGIRTQLDTAQQTVHDLKEQLEQVKKERAVLSTKIERQERDRGLLVEDRDGLKRRLEAMAAEQDTHSAHTSAVLVEGKDDFAAAPPAVFSPSAGIGLGRAGSGSKPVRRDSTATGAVMASPNAAAAITAAPPAVQLPSFDEEEEMEGEDDFAAAPPAVFSPSAGIGLDRSRSGGRRDSTATGAVMVASTNAGSGQGILNPLSSLPSQQGEFALHPPSPVQEEEDQEKQKRRSSTRKSQRGSLRLVENEGYTDMHPLLQEVETALAAMQDALAADEELPTEATEALVSVMQAALARTAARISAGPGLEPTDEQQALLETEVLVVCAEGLEDLMANHGHQALPVMLPVMPHVQALLVQGEVFKQERLVALSLFISMMMHANPGVLAAPFFSTFVPPLREACKDHHAFMRQTAVFGLGVVAEHGGPAAVAHMPAVASALTRVITAQNARDSTCEGVTDNAVAAAAKVCEFQRAALGEEAAERLLALVLDYLPAKADPEEAMSAHAALLRMARRGDAPLPARLPQVASVLESVLESPYVAPEVLPDMRAFLHILANKAPPAPEALEAPTEAAEHATQQLAPEAASAEAKVEAAPAVDTCTYTDLPAFKEQFPKSLATGPRMLSHCCGASGEGGWVVEVEDWHCGPIKATTRLTVQEAAGNRTEEKTVEEFMDFCEQYLEGENSRLVDQRFLPGAAEGELSEAPPGAEGTGEDVAGDGRMDDPPPQPEESLSSLSSWEETDDIPVPEPLPAAISEPNTDRF